MEQQMNILIREDYLTIAKTHYQESDKREKGEILIELENRTGMHRKSLIRLLRSKDKNRGKRGPGRKKKYDDPELFRALFKIWQQTNLMCSKRLKAALPLWLPFMKDNEITDTTRKLLYDISPRSIDRLFSKVKLKFKKKGLCTTKPGSIIKNRIPVKTEQWEENRLGFFEADTVAHCGGSTAGQFVFTLNLVDVATGWTIQRAVWGNWSIRGMQSPYKH
jgi:transposase